MVNLSLGLAYVHYGLKRQSTNRQYLLLQGQSFLSQYAELGGDYQAQQNSPSKAEAYYNLGRLFQLLGINYLGVQYYLRAEVEEVGSKESINLKKVISYNKFLLLLNNNNKNKALALLKYKIKI